MSRLTCESVRDELPTLLAGASAPAHAAAIAAHLAACPECRAEADFITRLQRFPVAAPPELELRVRTALMQRPRRWLFPARPALAAAAAVLIALGALRLLDTAPNRVAVTAPAAADATLPLPTGALPGSDGILAGSVLLESLTDDELALLLAEMES
jgi:predicted anti-sigma-YlaC factor YlaD